MNIYYLQQFNNICFFFSRVLVLIRIYGKYISFAFIIIRAAILQVYFAYFNPLKTKGICFRQRLSAYRAVNTFHFGYKNQSLNV
jgi:hypothetical protein